MFIVSGFRQLISFQWIVVLGALPFLLANCKKKDEAPAKKADFRLYNGFINSMNSGALDGEGKIIVVYAGNTGGVEILRSSPDGLDAVKSTANVGYTMYQPSVVTSGTGSIFIAAAGYKNYSLTKYNIILAKCHSNGDTIWTKSYGTSENEYPRAIKRTRDGGILVVGRGENAFSSFNIILIKLDANGTELWTREIAMSSSFIASDFIENPLGEILVSGVDNSSGNSVVVKLNSNGYKVDQNSIPVANFTGINSIVLCEDGNYILSASDAADVVLIKIDANCDVLWNKRIGYSDHAETCMTMVSNQDGTITLTGTSNGPKTNNTPDVLVMRVNETGQSIWYRAFGGKATDQGNCIVKDVSGNNVVIGFSNSFTTNFASQVFTVSMDNDGNFK